MATAFVYIDVGLVVDSAPRQVRILREYPNPEGLREKMGREEGSVVMAVVGEELTLDCLRPGVPASAHLRDDDLACYLVYIARDDGRNEELFMEKCGSLAALRQRVEEHSARPGYRTFKVVCGREVQP